MKITNLKVIPKDDTSKGALASVEVTFDFFLHIRGITLMNTNNGLWLSMPSRTYEKDGEQKYYSYVCPSKGFEEYLLSLVNQKYQHNIDYEQMNQDVNNKKIDELRNEVNLENSVENNDLTSGIEEEIPF